MSTKIPSPQEFFGHQMGADRKLAHWSRIVEYFWELDKSPMVKVSELGKSTEGHPSLLAVVTSEENMGRLEELREMSWRLAHPRDAPPEEMKGPRLGRKQDPLASLRDVAKKTAQAEKFNAALKERRCRTVDIEAALK